MCTRGIYQLKRLSLQYCDYGGSSKGVRDFLQSEYLKEFLEKNPQINFEFYMKRGFHPYISSSYINGYVKDQSLRGLQPEEILKELLRYRNSSGRKHIEHSGKKVYGSIKSIQGGWKPNMWSDYPRFELEYKKEIPTFDKEIRVIEKDRLGEEKKLRHRDEVNAFLNSKEPPK